MGDHAVLISNLKLVKELNKSARRDGISSEDVVKLAALVNDVADIAGPLLERIPATFKQYTEHNIRHCRNLIDLMGRFIPRKTLACLNGLELAVLILSALLHDFGMFVTEDEKREALRSKEFESFLASHHDRAVAVAEARERGDHERAEVIEDALLAEYFRRMHPERARVNVQKNLEGKLVFGDVDISPYVLDVCESHAWGVHESNDPRRPEKAVSRLSTNRAVYGVPLNLQYIACCLRLADIMDFDRSRTPLVVFQNIDFTEGKSWQEWNKHLQVTGWTINESEVMFHTECTHPEFYVAVMEFLDWVDVELSECRRLVVKEAPSGVAEKYKLHLPPVVDRSAVEMKDKNYLAGAFRFQLEYERIMQLLMDKSLYPDQSLFLRELLQNSLDACRNREAHAKENEAEKSYTPRITVWDYSADAENPRIVFQDNGVGMSRKIVENYFMRVGRSYYRSPEFDAERERLKAKGIELEATSQFGIGILSCFMVADRFEVETYRVGNRPLHIAIEGPTKYFIIKLLDEPPRTDFQKRPATDIEDGPPRRPGTRVTVHLRSNEGMSVAQVLEQFAVNLQYDLYVYSQGRVKPKKIRRRGWESNKMQLSNFPAATGETGYHSDHSWALLEEFEPRPSVSKVLEDVLIPSVIDFQKYDFSRQLRGKAWLWLLRGENGEPCPERGYLRLAQDIELIGLPKFIGQFQEPLIYYSDLEGFLKILNKANKKSDAVLKSEVYQHFVESYGEYSRVSKDQAELFADSFMGGWRKLSSQEKRAACDSFEALGYTRPEWLEVPGVARELLLGSTNWSKQSINLVYRRVLNELPQSFALHGVSLPGGFLKWDPMHGYARKVKLLAVPGVIRLDSCGSLAPTPAASRLFVDVKEARRTAVPFVRAVLRHVFELAGRHLDNPVWQNWLRSFLESTMPLYFWPEAVREEIELLEQRLVYSLGSYSNQQHMSREQLIEKYGRWVPVYDRDKQYADKQFGLNIGDDITAILVSPKLRRKRNRIWEVDMMSATSPGRDTLEQIQDGWLADIMK